jgi:ACS family sodium-dependent inorganic phosphate cotransporter
MVALLAFFGFCVIYMLRVNLSVAVVAMTANKTHTLEDGSIMIYPDFSWDSTTQGFILGSFFYGYIITQIPGGFLATKYGGKRVFLAGIAATSVLTLLTPLFAKAGTGYLITTRILEGLFEGMTYPSIHAIWARCLKTYLVIFHFYTYI